MTDLSIYRDSNNKIIKKNLSFLDIPSVNTSLGIIGTNAFVENLNVTNSISIGGIKLDTDTSKLNYLTNSTPGIATSDSALVTDSFNKITGIDTVDCDNLIVNNTVINSTSLSTSPYLQDISLGTAGIEKALITDSYTNISGINELTSTKLITGSLDINSSILTDNEINLLTDITPGTVSANKSVIVDENKNISDINDISIYGNIISNNTDDSSSINTGSVVFNGGVGIAKSMFIGQNLTVEGDLNISGNTTSINTSETLFEDNSIVLNATPSGTGHDSGLLVNRYQNNNDIGEGDIITDMATETYPIENITNNTIELTSSASNIADYYNNWWIKIISGNGENQIRKIISYDNTIKTITLDSDFTTLPAISDNVSLYNKNYPMLIWKESQKSFICGFTDEDHTTSDVVAYSDLITKSITLNSSKLTSTEVEYLINNIKGTVQASKAVIADSSKNISGINNLSSTGINTINNTTDATSTTSASVVVKGGVGIAKSLYVGNDLNLNGSTLSSSEIDILTDITLGTSSASKVLTTDSNKDITGINNITSSGIINFSNTTDATSSSNGGAITISGGAAITKSLYVGTKLNVAGQELTNTNLSYISEITLGSTTASKVLTVDSNKDISGINKLTVGNLFSVNKTNNTTDFNIYQDWTNDLSTDIQVTMEINNIAPRFGTLSNHMFRLMAGGTMSMYLKPSGNISIGEDIDTYKLNVNGSHNAISYYLNGSSMLTSALTDVTSGTGEASKALILDSSKDIIGINNLTTSTLKTTDIIIGTSTSENKITFNGTYGDLGNTYTVISERIYKTPEKSELLLFKGNDYGDPDRIRLRAAEIRFQTFTSTESYDTLSDNNDRLTIINNGNVGIGTSSPSVKLSLGDDANNVILALYNSDANGTDFYGFGAISSSTLYHSKTYHKWYTGTKDNELGTLNMTLDSSSNLIVNGKVESKQFKVSDGFTNSTLFKCMLTGSVLIGSSTPAYKQIIVTHSNNVIPSIVIATINKNSINSDEMGVCVESKTATDITFGVWRSDSEGWGETNMYIEYLMIWV